MVGSELITKAVGNLNNETKKEITEETPTEKEAAEILVANQTQNK